MNECAIEAEPRRNSPPWLLGFTNLPYGVSGAYVGVAMPFLLHKAGVPVATIAIAGAMALLPSAYKIFWVPILDLGIRRRTWLMLAACLSAVCFSSSLLLKLPEQLTLFEILLVAGNVMAGLVASCNGGLVCTTVDP